MAAGRVNPHPDMVVPHGVFVMSDARKRTAGRTGCFLAVGMIALFSSGQLSCSSAPTAFVVNGPGGAGNIPPTLDFLEPIENQTRGQGDPLLIHWTDLDADSAALISFSLLNTQTNGVIVLVDGLAENDQAGPDTQTLDTTLIPQGTYNLFASISDEASRVDVFAMTKGANPERVVIRIVGAGEAHLSEPPQVAVTEPVFDLSVTQDDVVHISVQPTAASAAVPYDRDSDVTVYLLFDLDQQPNNDDPANPDPNKIIVLEKRSPIAEDSTGALPFDPRIDLGIVPARPNGDPYYVRATIDDGTNPRVHAYAPGTLSVVSLAAGTVDLADVGRTLSGSRFYGFNPAGNLGSSITAVTDFDADGTDDFMVAARFGNPQNVGPVGEAYLIYGQAGLRFGGVISINAVSNDVEGAVFHAPPVRSQAIPDPNARTAGITDLGFVSDLSGDGRPDLLFGLPHVHGAWDATDYDVEDADEQPSLCYPDGLVNNYSDAFDGILDANFFAGGMAVIVNSQNRDNRPHIQNPFATRLRTTEVSLELVVQLATTLDADGRNDHGLILARAVNVGIADGQIEADEPLRIAGGRFIAGGFGDRPRFFQGGSFSPLEPAREDMFGQHVGALGDITADGRPELIISAPRNERYLADIADDSPLGLGFSPHYFSAIYRGSINVFPGRNYNATNQRDINDDSGSSVTPFLDHWEFPPIGSCTAAPPVPRHYVSPAEAFSILAENVDDMLGDGQSAGDVNQDGLDDILCGAPKNDRTSSAKDTGATYVIYSRTVSGEILLDRANDPVLRPPMLRIRGLSPGDQIGWTQASGLDVNGDRIADVFLASPATDYGSVSRDSCGGDFNSDGTITQNDFALSSFNNCQQDVGDDVFSDDACKSFDYDNDGDIDDEDRCVFCCLSDDCEPNASCVHGRGASCCDDLVDNGFVGIVFGGRFFDGDRDITQIATTDLPGTIFFGGAAGHRAGVSISSAGDFNQDGYGDLLIAAPGEVRIDRADRERVGVVYLVFGGPHLENTVWNLSDPDRGVGSSELPGIIFLSPYVKGRPNEAAPTVVGLLGDINNDGFDDIGVGNPKADFIDLSFPQGPNAPGDDPAAGRRSNAGDLYIVYGNNFGSNRGTP